MALNLRAMMLDRGSICAYGGLTDDVATFDNTAADRTFNKVIAGDEVPIDETTAGGEVPTDEVTACGKLPTDKVTAGGNVSTGERVAASEVP